MDLVTTLRVVWIEMPSCEFKTLANGVTTLRVVWIEMAILNNIVHIVPGHHLAGGVD